MITPEIIALYSASAIVFALAHSSGLMGWMRTLLLLALTFIISLLFESVGVATGLVYGGYHYSIDLGPMFLGLVPYIIPLAWFMMSYPSLVIAIRVVPRSHNMLIWVLLVSAVGALVMTAWDLAIDPLMVSFGFWSWDLVGPYYGIPLLNYFGWWLTTFTIFLTFLILARLERVELIRSPTTYNRLPVVIYTITGLCTVLVALDRGLTKPALIGFFAMLPWILLSWSGKVEE